MNGEKPRFSISDLRDQPVFRKAVADRVWRAWWRDKGYPLDHIAKKVQQALAANVLPLTLVAHAGGLFLGTASVIETDMDERPQYAPWVAAVWVEPEHRKRGIGSALVAAAAETAFRQGFGTVHLCAAPAISSFYVRLGWRLIEEDVSGLNIFSLSPPS